MQATIRLLTRLGVEVVLPKDEGCCGAIVLHMGREADALAFARKNVDVWMQEIEGQGLDAILITTSGCGTTIKDYGFLLREDAAYAEKAARVASLAKDISEYLATLDLPAAAPKEMTVAYHSACSLQHGQKITDLPKRLLQQAGFAVRDVPEGHICCGSAGTYNLMQPFFARRLRQPQSREYRADESRCRRLRQYRLPDADRERHASFPSCIRSNCSIGHWAARGRRGWLVSAESAHHFTSTLSNFPFVIPMAKAAIWPTSLPLR